MINNPYKILGVPDGASEEECARAYKRLAKQYHPDLNPDNPEAAEKMAQINAAYDMIKNGNVNQSTGFNGYGAGRAQYEYSSSGSTDYFNSVKQFINSRQYQQALNLLNQIDGRSAQWYYLSAVANMGLGRRQLALSHIQQACAMDPTNPVYSSVYSQIRSGMYTESPFGSYYGGFGSDNGVGGEGEYRRYTTSRSSNRGCLSRILRFIFIIIVIRLVIYMLLSLATGALNHNHNRADNPPSSSHTQSQTESQSDYEDYFGRGDGSEAIYY